MESPDSFRDELPDNYQFSTFYSIARVERLELPANGFGDRYSTNWATPVYFALLNFELLANLALGETTLPPDSYRDQGFGIVISL